MINRKVQKELWLRRHAIQVAAQLPEDIEDARAVLAYMRELVDNFLQPTGGGTATKLHVIPQKQET